MIAQQLHESDGSYIMIACAGMFAVGLIYWLYNKIRDLNHGVLGDSKADQAELRDMAYHFTKFIEEFGLVALIGQAGFKPQDAMALRLLLQRFQKFMTPEMREKVEREQKKALTPRKDK